MTTFGVYVGPSASELAQFEQWLDREVDFVRAHGDNRTWDNYVNSVDWVGGLFEATGRDIYWSIPLITKEGNLASAAAGSYDQYWHEVAQAVLEHSPSDGPIYVRVGEEFNGGWFPWAAEGKEQLYIDSYRGFVDIFRSYSDRFVFEWNVAQAEKGMDPADAYPGDDYVDVIGMDFYYMTQWDGLDPVKAFNDAVNQIYGLQWLEDFAAAHGKPTAYSEWGVNTDNADAYIELAAQWFEDHNVLYQSYYNSNGGGPYKLDQYPSSAEAFREIYSVVPADDDPVDPPIVEDPPVEDPPVEDPSDPAPDGNSDSGAIDADDVVVEVWNATTDTKIATITPGDTLDPSLLGMTDITLVVSAAAGSPLNGNIGSVVLNFENGLYQRTESVSPYALFGDGQGDYYTSGGAPLFASAGSYDLSLSFHSLSAGGGELLGDVDIQFAVGAADDPVPLPPEPDPVPPHPDPEPGDDRTEIDGFSIELWSSQTDRKVAELTSGATFDPDLFTTGNSSIVVVATPGGVADGAVGSIVFTMDDHRKAESFVPYAMYGDRKGDLWGGLDLDPGTHEIEFEVYSGKNGNGDLLGKYSMPITVTETGAYVEQITTEFSAFDLL